MSSGDDIQAGEVTTAESTTDLLAAIPSEGDVDFNGDIILRVGPQPGALRPRHKVDGIMGVGANGTRTFRSAGGTGVVGIGAPNGGTGVRGIGSAHSQDTGPGNGGIGVHGLGGQGLVRGGQPDGAQGIVGQGGRAGDDDKGESRSLNGPGAVVFAGGIDPKTIDPAANLGLYAHGGDGISVTRISERTGILAPHGPRYAGPGVVGRGGDFRSDAGQPGGPLLSAPASSGAGVVGLTAEATLTAPNPYAFADNAGVYGRSVSGSGVSGDSVDGPGATFSSAKAAQIHLIPMSLTPPDPNRRVAGQGGDLLAVIDSEQRCSLWFCVRTGDGSSAQWKQIA